MKRLLQSFGLPTSYQGLLFCLIGSIILLLIIAAIGWLPAVIIAALAFGSYNGFFTKRKP